MDDEERGPVDGARSDGNAGAAKKKGGNWGPRGISVSADEDVMDQTGQPEGDSRANDGLVGLMEEDESEDEIWSSVQDTNSRLDDKNTQALNL